MEHRIPNWSMKNSYSKSDLLDCASGKLFGPGNAQLPSPPLMMIDRIMHIQSDGGKFGKGCVIAELDINDSLWFFDHHFQDDPIVPGCLLLEALWQLSGFHLAWLGYSGKGRVLDSGRTRFLHTISNDVQVLSIEIHVRRIMFQDFPLCVANGLIRNADLIVGQSEMIKVGLFR